MTLSDSYEPWICDYCTASCTYEAMSMCSKRYNVDAECGHEKDQPLALNENGQPSIDGCFEFVQLRNKVFFQGVPRSHVSPLVTFDLTDEQKNFIAAHDSLERIK